MGEEYGHAQNPWKTWLYSHHEGIFTARHIAVLAFTCYCVHLYYHGDIVTPITPNKGELAAEESVTGKIKVE